jgi:phosphatidylglycerophosphate synthase
MVESLKELNQKCQKPHYKTVGNWMVRNILRDAALPITWALLHTKVTANQITLLSLLVGLLGIAMFSTVSTLTFLLGTLLLQLWYLLDHVDGQLARYHQTASITGRFFDFLTHHIIHVAIFFALGVYMFNVTGNVMFMIWGFVLSLFMMSFNLIHDAKSKAFVEHMLKHETIKIFERTKSESEAKQTYNLLRLVFSWIHKCCEIHVLMNVLTAIAVIQIFFSGFELRSLLFIIYAVLIPLLTIAKTLYIITGQKFDQEFRSYFDVH